MWYNLINRSISVLLKSVNTPILTMAKLELWMPFKTYSISQKFGETANLAFYIANNIPITMHNGIDFVSPNSYVRASHDGTVVFAGEDGAGGLGVVIRTNEMFDYKDSQVYFKTIYWHLKTGTIQVRAGQQVFVGDILAEQDSTGLSTGNHLHYGLKPVVQGEQDWIWFNLEQDNGVMGAVDPTPYFNNRWAGDAKIMLSMIANLQEQIKILQQLIWIRKI